jgi:hypothetical protein
LIGGLVALITAYSYVRLTLAYPSKGGTVMFFNRAFGPGFFAGGMSTLLVLSYVAIMALYASAFATYGASLLPLAERAFWQVVLKCGIIVALALANLISPRLVEKSEGLFNVGKMSILLLFVVIGLASNKLTLQRLAPSEWVPAADIIASGMLVFLSYEGFELIANASIRIKDPGRTLPYAYYGSVVVATLMYVLIVVVALGHLTFDALSRAQDYSLCAAAETFMGRPGFILLAVGAILATASAINADFFGASKLPAVLSSEGEAPLRYGKEVWGRHPYGLLTIMVLVLFLANFMDPHSMSASASAGFLLVFAVVNIANARLASQTRSKKWLSTIGAVVCLGALTTMIVQLSLQPEHRHALWPIAGVAIFPFIYQMLYRSITSWLNRRSRP